MYERKTNRNCKKEKTDEREFLKEKKVWFARKKDTSLNQRNSYCQNLIEYNNSEQYYIYSYLIRKKWILYLKTA